MSACDSCRLPGRCCSGFPVGLDEERFPTALHVLVALATVLHGMEDGDAVGGWQQTRMAAGAEHVQLGLPFMPLGVRPVPVHGHLQWLLWCPLLDHATGRCGDYENRPALCRDYQAGSDALCAEYEGVPPMPVGMPS